MEFKSILIKTALVGPLAEALQCPQTGVLSTEKVTERPQEYQMHHAACVNPTLNGCPALLCFKCDYVIKQNK